MPDSTFLDWPFFDDRHRALKSGLDEWCAANAALLERESGKVDAQCRALVRSLGEGGWLAHAVGTTPAHGTRGLEVRALALIRETLAYHSGLADFCFAMQGLGSGPISLFGTDAQRQAFLPGVAAGDLIAAFALSEKAAGSDVAALKTRAQRHGDHYVLNGEKCWISNAGIADYYVIFARTGDGPGTRDLEAFIVDASSEGLQVSERFDLIAPHPLGALELRNCRVPASRRLGEPAGGFRIAMATLDVFRTTVGAAALGFARRAYDEALARACNRELFGGTLGDLQMTQASLAEMAVDVDASALLIYRSAWAKDNGQARVTREAAMAKLHATERAQAVIDRAVQLFGGEGVVAGTPVERLYRDIRPLRIYEGTSEIQKIIIARHELRAKTQGRAR